MPLAQWQINKMSRESKVKRYLWRVDGLNGCIEYWMKQMKEPEEYGVFNDWEQCEAQGSGLTDVMDEMIALACDIDPECVPVLQDVKKSIINLRIKNYEVMTRLHDTPDPPMPTPEEEAAAEAEMIETYAKIGKKPPKKHGQVDS